MAKLKGPKLKLSFLDSFHICHPKKPSSMARSPVPRVTYSFSPPSGEFYGIPFPSFTDSPPSTPSKITPFESALQTYAGPKDRKKLFNSPVSSDFDEKASVVAPARNGRRNYTNAAKNVKAMSISYYESDENDDSLFSSPPSLNSSYDHFDHPFKASKKPMQQQTRFRQQRCKRFGSKEWKSGDEHREKKSSIPHRGAKVNESFVVVKKSVDPYTDFKSSMLEMILEKQMFEPKELETLLMSFLSLNARIHHKVIVEAFTEIMKFVLYG